MQQQNEVSTFTFVCIVYVHLRMRYDWIRIKWWIIVQVIIIKHNCIFYTDPNGNKNQILILMSRMNKLLWKLKTAYSLINNLSEEITFYRHLNRAEIERLLVSKKIYLCPKSVAEDRWWKCLDIFSTEMKEKAVLRRRRRCFDSAANRRAKSRSDNFQRRSRDSSRSELLKKRERRAAIADHRSRRNREADFGPGLRGDADRDGASSDRTFRAVRSAEVCRASNLRKDATVSAVKGRNAKRLPRPLRKGLKHLRSIIFCIREN